MAYNVRLVCLVGDWHYYTTTQSSVDDTLECPDHPGGSTRDFVIEWFE